MTRKTMLLGETVPLGQLPGGWTSVAEDLVIPYWPSDPEVGGLSGAGSVEILMPTRWSPPLGPSVRYRRLSYLQQFRSLENCVDVLVVAAQRIGNRWVLPMNHGLTGAIGMAGVESVLVFELSASPVAIGAAELHAQRLEVVQQASGSSIRQVGRVADAAERAIAGKAASLVTVPSVFEVGVGHIPNLVLDALAPGQVLGFLSGVLTDRMIQFAIDHQLDHGPGSHRAIRGAMVNGSGKQLQRAVGMGLVELLPPQATHGGGVAGAPFVALNGAIQVDLKGNVNTEYSGGRAVSGRGGHPDFCASAASDPMGLSVVVLKSIDRQGRSGIVSRLPPAWVSTPGRNVDVVVTEWGVADLRGLSEHGRALAIANVASPLLRRQLLTGWDAGR